MLGRNSLILHLMLTRPLHRIKYKSNQFDSLYNSWTLHCHLYLFSPPLFSFLHVTLVTHINTASHREWPMKKKWHTQSHAVQQIKRLTAHNGVLIIIALKCLNCQAHIISIICIFCSREFVRNSQRIFLISHTNAFDIASLAERTGWASPFSLCCKSQFPASIARACSVDLQRSQRATRRHTQK